MGERQKDFYSIAMLFQPERAVQIHARDRTSFLSRAIRASTSLAQTRHIHSLQATASHAHCIRCFAPYPLVSILSVLSVLSNLIIAINPCAFHISMRPIFNGDCRTLKYVLVDAARFADHKSYSSTVELTPAKSSCSTELIDSRGSSFLESRPRDGSPVETC
jgi:hypothetical protein